MLLGDGRGYLEAYAAGVNEWIAANGGPSATGAKSLEYTILGLQNGDYEVEPWTPVDSLAWLKAMAWDLRGNMESEIARAVLLASGLTRSRWTQLYPAYPYDRNQPIVTRRRRRRRLRRRTATAPPRSATPARRGIAWSAAAPALSALAAAVGRAAAADGRRRTGHRVELVGGRRRA